VNYSINELNKISQTLRADVVKMIGYGKAGHFGGSCSIADVVAALYFSIMKLNPDDSKMKGRDRFLMSKGHSALVQYAALAERGFFPKEDMKSLKKLGAKLQGHPDMRKVPGIEANTGSLGQGLSIAAGMAAGAKLDKESYRVYCIMGDGELAEGQIWEAAMAAANYKLDNLIGIVDQNRLQASGTVEEIFNTNPLIEKWEAFGWDVVECDGHNMEEILEAFEKAQILNGKPHLVLAHTIKGKGIPCAENVVAFHNGTLTQEQYETTLAELTKKGGIQE